MDQPTPEQVEFALKAIEARNQPSPAWFKPTLIDLVEDHPRVLAAKAVAEFRGRVENAPKCNQHDRDSPVLLIDETITRSEPHYLLNSEARVPWWRRVLRLFR